MAVTVAPMLVQGNRVGTAPGTITFRQAPIIPGETGHGKAALVLQLIATIAVATIATVAVVRVVNDLPEQHRPRVSKRRAA